MGFDTLSESMARTLPRSRTSPSPTSEMAFLASSPRTSSTYFTGALRFLESRAACWERSVKSHLPFLL